jgi:hypothetical protein
MLSVDDFSVGNFSDATPGSLILPRNDREVAALIGSIRDEPHAVLLSGEYLWHTFSVSRDVSWSGLIIPNVRIELDETSLFDPAYGAQIGSVQRARTALTLRARSDRSPSSVSFIIQEDLPPLGNNSAGFHRWQIVLGIGDSKRILWQSPSEE